MALKQGQQVLITIVRQTLHYRMVTFWEGRNGRKCRNGHSRSNQLVVQMNDLQYISGFEQIDTVFSQIGNECRA